MTRPSGSTEIISQTTVTVIFQALCRHLRAQLSLFGVGRDMRLFLFLVFSEITHFINLLFFSIISFDVTSFFMSLYFKDKYFLVLYVYQNIKAQNSELFLQLVLTKAVYLLICKENYSILCCYFKISNLNLTKMGFSIHFEIFMQI